jgi:phage tail P2-like protein
MSEFQSILPPNSTQTERALEQAFGAQKPDLAPVAQLMRPGLCPAPLLGWLAWAVSVDVWDPNWADEDKRSVIAGSVSVHRHKGTIGAVRRALVTAGYGTAQIVEAKQSALFDGSIRYDGTEIYEGPDHWAEYRIYLDHPITANRAIQVRDILARVAPARSHLKGLYFIEAAHSYNAAISYDGSFTHGVVQ